MLVEMPHITLMLPVELSEHLTYEQSEYNEAVTTAFYMKNGEEETPLFRVDVGDESLGDWMGLLHTESGDIPVTYTVFGLTGEQLEGLDEEAQALYGELMGGFNDMMNNIMSDSRFEMQRPVPEVEEEAAAMYYWTVELPVGMLLTETNKNGVYEALFSTEIQGENVPLYAVRIGASDSESEFGLFEIDGEAKPISIESYDLSGSDSWTEADFDQA